MSSQRENWSLNKYVFVVKNTFSPSGLSILFFFFFFFLHNVTLGCSSAFKKDDSCVCIKQTVIVFLISSLSCVRDYLRFFFFFPVFLRLYLAHLCKPMCWGRTSEGRFNWNRQIELESMMFDELMCNLSTEMGRKEQTWIHFSRNKMVSGTIKRNMSLIFDFYFLHLIIVEVNMRVCCLLCFICIIKGAVCKN